MHPKSNSSQIAATESEGKRIYRRATVLQRLDGISVSCLYRWMSDPKVAFPRPFPLGGGGVAWSAQEVDAWIEGQIARKAGAA